MIKKIIIILLIFTLIVGAGLFFAHKKIDYFKKMNNDIKKEKQENKINIYNISKLVLNINNKDFQLKQEKDNILEDIDKIVEMNLNQMIKFDVNTIIIPYNVLQNNEKVFYIVLLKYKEHEWRQVDNFLLGINISNLNIKKVTNAIKINYLLKQDDEYTQETFKTTELEIKGNKFREQHSEVEEKIIIESQKVVGPDDCIIGIETYDSKKENCFFTCNNYNKCRDITKIINKKISNIFSDDFLEFKNKIDQLHWSQINANDFNNELTEVQLLEQLKNKKNITELWNNIKKILDNNLLYIKSFVITQGDKFPLDYQDNTLFINEDFLNNKKIMMFSAEVVNLKITLINNFGDCQNFNKTDCIQRNTISWFFDQFWKGNMFDFWQIYTSQLKELRNKLNNNESEESETSENTPDNQGDTGEDNINHKVEQVLVGYNDLLKRDDYELIASSMIKRYPDNFELKIEPQSPVNDFVMSYIKFLFLDNISTKLNQDKIYVKKIYFFNDFVEAKNEKVRIDKIFRKIFHKRDLYPLNY